MPFISDEALVEKARQLNQQHGRPPTATELISAAGGCQKQRALRAIQQFRVELAQKAVRSSLVLPTGVREDLDHLAGRLLDRAAEQLAEKQAQFELVHEQKLLAAREEVEHLTQQVESLRARLADAEHLQQELLEAQRGSTPFSRTLLRRPMRVLRSVHVEAKEVQFRVQAGSR